MRVREATPADAERLAALAALTFPLACPPHTTDEAKSVFIAANLSATSFEGYLADPQRRLFVAEVQGELAGYTMLVAGEPSDADVAAAVTRRPTIELSKCYVHPDSHGAGVAAALMSRSLADAEAAGAASIWLGVNQLNDRAQRFYGKHGFVRVGSKRFLVGDRYEDDYVYERPLR
ncbi:MAG: GNAT family N-acetyltransferase [Protaetiibacter sp.]